MNILQLQVKKRLTEEELQDVYEELRVISEKLKVNDISLLIYTKHKMILIISG